MHTSVSHTIRRPPIAPDSSSTARISGEIPQRPQVLLYLIELDQRAFERISSARSPGLDTAMTLITDASRHARLLVMFSGVLSVFGGVVGRRSAGEALIAVGVTTTAANAVVKSAAQRGPAGSAPGPVLPSGRTASASAFATVVGDHIPALSLPLNSFAAAVGASRVYNGVHHPRNVALGWLFGKAVGIAVLRIGRAVEDRQRRGAAQ
ncbi:MAG: phosphatase PAP2 family protein [Acidimicrobiia bacterium]